MEIQINIDKEELDKLLQMGMIDNKEDKEQVTAVIHDMIYQHSELYSEV